MHSLLGLAAWREAPYYSEAERAAFALAEAATRLSDRADAVTDEVWREASRHGSEAALGALVMTIGLAKSLEPPQRRDAAGRRRLDQSVRRSTRELKNGIKQVAVGIMATAVQALLTATAAARLSESGSRQWWVNKLATSWKRAGRPARATVTSLDGVCARRGKR
jgi:hypothetical protein